MISTIELFPAIALKLQREICYIKNSDLDGALDVSDAHGDTPRLKAKAELAAYRDGDISL